MSVSLLPDTLCLVRFPTSEVNLCTHAILKQLVFRSYCTNGSSTTQSEPLFSYVDNSLEISIFGDAETLQRDFPLTLCPGLEISSHVYRALQVDNDLSHEDSSSSSRICSVVEPLAKAGVSIFYMSTYQTDLLFVRESDLLLVSKTLASHGMNIEELEFTPPDTPIPSNTKPSLEIPQPQHHLDSSSASSSFSASSIINYAGATRLATAESSSSSSSSPSSSLSSASSSSSSSSASATTPLEISGGRPGRTVTDLIDKGLQTLESRKHSPQRLSIDTGHHRHQKPSHVGPESKEPVFSQELDDDSDSDDGEDAAEDRRQQARERSPTTTTAHEIRQQAIRTLPENYLRCVGINTDLETSSPQQPWLLKIIKILFYQEKTKADALDRWRRGQGQGRGQGPYDPYRVCVQDGDSDRDSEDDEENDEELARRQLAKLEFLPPRFFSFTATNECVSMITDLYILEEFEEHELFMSMDESPLRLIQLDLHRFGLDKYGIIHSVSRPLTEAGIELMYLSTFSTANILVLEHSLADAEKILSGNSGASTPADTQCSSPVEEVGSSSSSSDILDKFTEVDRCVSKHNMVELLSTPVSSGVEHSNTRSYSSFSSASSASFSTLPGPTSATRLSSLQHQLWAEKHNDEEDDNVYEKQHEKERVEDDEEQKEEDMEEEEDEDKEQ